jgi:hypothetical protein
MLANGGYTVQPVPTPCSTKLLASSSPNAGGSNQKLMLFRRGNTMCPAAWTRGQFFKCNKNLDVPNEGGTRIVHPSFNLSDSLFSFNSKVVLRDDKAMYSCPIRNQIA